MATVRQHSENMVEILHIIIGLSRSNEAKRFEIKKLIMNGISREDEGEIIILSDAEKGVVNIRYKLDSEAQAKVEIKTSSKEGLALAKLIKNFAQKVLDKVKFDALHP